MEKALKYNDIFFGFTTVIFYNLFFYSIYCLFSNITVKGIDTRYCIPVFVSFVCIVLSYILWFKREFKICQKYDKKQRISEKGSEIRKNDFF